MVGAGEKAAGIALVFVAQHGPTVGTPIVQNGDFAAVAPHEQHRLATDHKADIVARLAKLRFMAGVNPCLIEDIFELLLKDGLVGVAAAMNTIALHQQAPVRRSCKRFNRVGQCYLLSPAHEPCGPAGIFQPGDGRASIFRRRFAVPATLSLRPCFAVSGSLLGAEARSSVSREQCAVQRSARWPTTRRRYGAPATEAHRGGRSGRRCRRSLWSP